MTTRQPTRQPARSGRVTGAPSPGREQPGAHPGTAHGGPALVEALQRSAGNGAVVQVVQRLASSNGNGTGSGNGTGAAPPLRPVGTSPHDDPRFLAVKGKIIGESSRLAAHPPPQTEASKAQHAAVPPIGDKAAQAKAAQVEEMAAARPGGFDKAAFIAAVRQAIAAHAPRNLDEADKFADSGKPAAIKGQIVTKVTEGKRNAARDIAGRTAQAPDTSVAKEKTVIPLRAEEPPAPAPIDAGPAMPAPAPPEQTDLGTGKRETEATMAAAGVTEEQLTRSNEPQFLEALTAKKEGEKHSLTAPAQLRASESSKLGGARRDAQAAGKGGLAAMARTKGHALLKAAAGKNASKAKDEAKRAEITAHIGGVFDATKKDVGGILDALDGAVATRFDTEEKAARDAFAGDHKARMQRYKDERYAGISGAARWAADLFRGLPAEANQIFAQSKAGYESRMTRVISEIADFIGAELGRAKARIAAGRAEITRYVALQPRELQRVAQDAASQFAGQFDELEAEVDSKRDALVDDLASRYVEARTAVDDEIKAMQDQNTGLWDRAKTAVASTVDTILKLKEMLLGVLARAVGAIDRIIADPIGFLGNLVGAVKTGVTNFAANIVEHLKKGLQGWLLGSLADAGIELPDKFDLKGIVQLVLSLLGVTWANIRARIVRVIPESAMSTLERSVGFIQVILTEGVGGLWKWVVDKLGDLRELVMSQIQDFVVTKIVKAGITWLISLLNPAAAFVKACKVIYDVVMFFVEKASQIKEFVDSVLDSIESIAGGGVGAVAGYIERTMAKSLPMVLGFLASVLGLGGISEQIKKVLQTIQKPVMSVVDALVAGAVKVGKKLLGGAVAWGRRKAGKAREWVREKGAKAREWVARTFRGRTMGFDMAGESHRLIVPPGPEFTLQVASAPRAVRTALAGELAAAEEEYRDRPAKGDGRVVAVKGLIRQAREVEQAGRKFGGDDPRTVELLTYLYEAMSQYGRRFNRRGFGYPRGAEARVGEQAPYGRQAVGGGGALTREHVVPGKLIAAFLGLAADAFYDRFYRRMTTLIWEKAAADYKTYSHPRNDNLAIREVKARRRAGETLHWSTIVHDRLVVTKESRDAAKSTVTDAAIDRAALAQLRETDDIEELSGRLGANQRRR
jgi:hypothetical protein